MSMEQAQEDMAEATVREEEMDDTEGIPLPATERHLAGPTTPTPLLRPRLVMVYLARGNPLTLPLY